MLFILRRFASVLIAHLVFNIIDLKKLKRKKYYWKYLLIIIPIAITTRIAGIQGMSIVSIFNSLNSQAIANINKITANTGNFVFAILPPFYFDKKIIMF